MGSRKSHAEFRLLGKATSKNHDQQINILAENRFIPRMRGRAKTRAARDFLKTIVASILELRREML